MHSPKWQFWIDRGGTFTDVVARRPSRSCTAIATRTTSARPGPACYRNGGPLTVTDCNVLLGKIQAAHFPKVFGADGRQSLDTEAVRERFAELTQAVNAGLDGARTAEEVAEGFLAVAVGNMAEAIKKISLARGHDPAEYTLCCFGGAGGQSACQVADALGIRRIFLHPLAGVLSAYGMGVADQCLLFERATVHPPAAGTTPPFSPATPCRPAKPSPAPPSLSSPPPPS